MYEAVVYCIITVSLIAAFSFAWFFYQQARNKERMLLIEKGASLDEIFSRYRADPDFLSRWRSGFWNKSKNIGITHPFRDRRCRNNGPR
jgi:hypothetical protein